MALNKKNKGGYVIKQKKNPDLQVLIEMFETITKKNIRFQLSFPQCDIKRNISMASFEIPTIIRHYIEY